MAEMEEVHKFWSSRDVLILKGEHAGKSGFCQDPCACYYYDVYVRDEGKMVVLEEGDFDLPEDQREKVMEGLRAKRRAEAEQT
ncbi:hypothetical protein ACFLSJ_00545 [Verrucomicrobiota bacterium]